MEERYKIMYIINFFGAPCVGKSTFATGVFYRLKKYSDINVELVTEVAKDLCWENNEIALHDQLYIAGLQNYRLSRLNDKVDIVITDAPLMLQTIYYRLNDRPCQDEFEKVILNHSKEYNNINYMLYPLDKYKYIKSGRNYDSSSQEKITNEILNMLNRNNIDYIDITDDIDIYKICRDIEKIYHEGEKI